jgi:hypothetical protein
MKAIKLYIIALLGALVINTQVMAENGPLASLTCLEDIGILIGPDKQAYKDNANDIENYILNYRASYPTFATVVIPGQDEYQLVKDVAEVKEIAGAFCKARYPDRATGAWLHANLRRTYNSSKKPFRLEWYFDPNSTNDVSGDEKGLPKHAPAREDYEKEKSKLIKDKAQSILFPR